MSARSDAIATAHIGDNAFTAHRDVCSICAAAVRRQRHDETGLLLGLCAEGDRATDRAIELLGAQLIGAERS
jgi:hypothetical protein